NVILRIISKRKQNLLLIGADERLQMTAERGYVARGDNVAIRELVLEREVVTLNVGRLIVKLDSAQGQTGGIHIYRVQGHARQSVFDGGNAAVREVIRRYGIRSREIEGVLERVVIPKAWVSASVLECSVENAVPAAHHQTPGRLVRESEARRKVVLLDNAQAGAVRVRVVERDAILG